jgi:hypothetical protein
MAVLRHAAHVQRLDSDHRVVCRQMRSELRDSAINKSPFMRGSMRRLNWWRRQPRW